jgi:hypothetical protein
MPFIKRVKKGMFPSLDGDKAYELIEVGEAGLPINNNLPKPRKYGKTEPKIGPGLRAPDVEKGYSKNFDYHLWNRLLKEGKVHRKK